MNLVAENSNAQHSPLRFQLDVPWESATPEAKLQCLEKASEDFHLIGNMTAPESRAELYKVITSQSVFEPSSDLEVLMMAYKNPNPLSLRIQILIFYTFMYPIPVLMKLHEPYKKLTHYQVKRARKHAKIHGPGTVPEKELKHHVRLDIWQRLIISLSLPIDCIFIKAWHTAAEF